MTSNPSSKNSRNAFELFDYSDGYDNEAAVVTASNLSPEDKRLASTIYKVFTPPREATGLWGLCMVKGLPGSGKDVFDNWLSFNIKRLFPWKRVLRDEPPRALYGPYAGLFNEETLHDTIAKMNAIGKGIPLTEVNAAREKAADDWVKGAGEVMLKNSVAVLAEFWNYCYKRDPHKPINKVMGAIHKVKRHLDVLILGNVQLTDDLDKFTAKPFVDWMVTCTRSTRNITGFVFFVQPVKYDRRLDVFVPSSARPYPFPVDAGEPREEIGDGKIQITPRGWQYEPETEEERVVLEVIKSGVSDYGELVNILESEECEMSPAETLLTVKDLGLRLPGRRPKMVLDYPCYFRIFNSKNAIQIKSDI